MRACAGARINGRKSLLFVHYRSAVRIAKVQKNLPSRGAGFIYCWTGNTRGRLCRLSWRRRKSGLVMLDTVFARASSVYVYMCVQILQIYLYIYVGHAEWLSIIICRNSLDKWTVSLLLSRDNIVPQIIACAPAMYEIIFLVVVVVDPVVVATHNCTFHLYLLIISAAQNGSARSRRVITLSSINEYYLSNEKIARKMCWIEYSWWKETN